MIGITSRSEIASLFIMEQDFTIFAATHKLEEEEESKLFAKANGAVVLEARNETAFNFSVEQIAERTQE